MTSERTFDGVSDAVWQCLRAYSQREYGTVFDPPDASQGIATTKTYIGDVVLAFDYQSENETLTFRIEKKPIVVPAGQIWNGFVERIELCESEVVGQAGS